MLPFPDVSFSFFLSLKTVWGSYWNPAVASDKSYGIPSFHQPHQPPALSNTHKHIQDRHNASHPEYVNDSVNPECTSLDPFEASGIRSSMKAPFMKEKKKGRGKKYNIHDISPEVENRIGGAM